MKCTFMHIPTVTLNPLKFYHNVTRNLWLHLCDSNGSPTESPMAVPRSPATTDCCCGVSWRMIWLNSCQKHATSSRGNKDHWRILKVILQGGASVRRIKKGWIIETCGENRLLKGRLRAQRSRAGRWRWWRWWARWVRWVGAAAPPEKGHGDGTGCFGNRFLLKG